MRNKKWYLAILKGKTKEWAYNFIKDNLKAPSFVYEQQNAYAAYQEIFGIEFASPEEMRAKTDKEEIERLKTELEAAKAQKQASTLINDVSILPDGSVESKIKGTPVIFTKEQFKQVHPELKGISIHHAWVKYAKEKGIEK